MLNETLRDLLLTLLPLDPFIVAWIYLTISLL